LFKERKSSFPLTRVIPLRFWVSVIAVSNLGLITKITFFFIKKFSSHFFFIGFLDKCESLVLICLCVILKVILCDLRLGQKFSWFLLVDIFPFCFVQIKKKL
jgi:hypothetical protein